jgi:hypothetical protein
MWRILFLALYRAGGVRGNTEGTPCFLTIQSTTFDNNSSTQNFINSGIPLDEFA